LPTLTKPRKKKDVTIRLDLYQWIEDQIERGKFWNFSHGIEIALEKLKDTEKEEKQLV
jgi:Arc/MetJ-type ribon-helix-helix transcriptional regulator